MITKQRWLAVLVALGMATTLAACGSGNDTAKETAAPTTTAKTASNASTASKKGSSAGACTFLTDAEVSTAFGSPFAGEETDPDTRPMGGSQCVWTDNESQAAETFSLSIVTDATLSEPFRKAGQTPAKQYETAEKNAASQDGYEALSGLGDHAFMANTRISVLKGTAFVTYSTLLGDSDTAIAGLKSLATTATARI